MNIKTILSVFNKSLSGNYNGELKEMLKKASVPSNQIFYRFRYAWKNQKKFKESDCNYICQL